MPNINNYVALLVGAQVAAFGWRLNREIAVGDAPPIRDKGRFRSLLNWIPVPDLMNMVSMVVVVWFCIIQPIIEGEYGRTTKIVLAGAGALLAFHPMMMASHYELWTGGRSPKREDWEYCPAAEKIWCGIAIGGVIVACSLAYIRTGGA